MESKTCPLCRRQLSLKQINFTTALYICEDLNCQYPIGHKCIVVQRSVQDMNKVPEETTKEDDAYLSNWTSDILETDTKTEVENPPCNSNPTTSETNFTVDDFDDILSFLHS